MTINANTEVYAMHPMAMPVGGGFLPKVAPADLQALMRDNDAVLSELQREGPADYGK